MPTEVGCAGAGAFARWPGLARLLIMPADMDFENTHSKGMRTVSRGGPGADS
jgi:hypothetical protein